MRRLFFVPNTSVNVGGRDALTTNGYEIVINGYYRAIDTIYRETNTIYIVQLLRNIL